MNDTTAEQPPACAGAPEGRTAKGVALWRFVRPLVNRLNDLPSVLGTVYQERCPPWAEGEPFITCFTHLDKRQLDLDRTGDGPCGDSLHEAGRMLRAAGFQANLTAGSVTCYEWTVFAHGSYDLA